MRTAVYNRYWSTGGGAEMYGAAIAQVLSGDGPLDLLTHDPVDVDWLAERLGLDLSAVDVRTIDDDPGEVTNVSSDYDLFVNVSYMSADRAGTRHSLYVVHFPTSLDGDRGTVGRWMADTSDRVVHAFAPVEVEWGDGFHPRPPEPRAVWWTGREATLRFTTPPGQPAEVTFIFGYRPRVAGSTPVRIEVDGRKVAEKTLTLSGSRWLAHAQARLGAAIPVRVESAAPGEPVEVKLISDSFVPADVLGSDDRRRLGLPLKAIRVGRGWSRHLTRWLPIAMDGPDPSSWTQSYGAIVCNSKFTQRWVDRRWHSPSEVLNPPVGMLPAAEQKQPIIVHVGRFFDAAQGHSKKQLELVQAFRQLCDGEFESGLPDSNTGRRAGGRAGVGGWSLHLVGGCGRSGESYLESVRAAAAGYPVEFHVNATGSERDSLFGKASIYWHASGLGEDPQRHPERMEHFGITTVEAMSAGAVPVVIGLAGQLETVRNGVDGFHFRTIDELVSLTTRLIEDDDERARLSASARRRAEDFSIDAFEKRLRAIVDRVLALT